MVADIIVIVLLSIVINKSIVRPAIRAKNDLDDIILGIESGQGNLTLRVFDETSDEIGQLANGVNHFIETLQNLSPLDPVLPVDQYHPYPHKYR